MPHLCSHQQQVLKRKGPQAYELWHNTMQKGHTAFSHQRYDDAFGYFAAAAEITAFLLEHYSQKPKADCQTSLSLTEMRVNACHNLAATAMASGNTDMSEKILFALHEEIATLCQDGQCQRWLRLDALTSLKNTLFSLVSHLGERGNITELRTIVRQTEEQAQRAAQQLWH